jgi:hypothetical protein
MQKAAPVGSGLLFFVLLISEPAMIVPRRLNRRTGVVRHGDSSFHHLLCIYRLLDSAVHRNLVYFVEVLPVQADQIRAEPVAALRIQAVGGFPTRRQDDQITECSQFFRASGERMPGIWPGFDGIGRNLQSG